MTLAWLLFCSIIGKLHAHDNIILIPEHTALKERMIIYTKLIIWQSTTEES